MGNPLTDKQFIRLLDDKLTKVYHDQYDGLPLIIDTFYNRMKSTKAWEEFFSIGDIPDPEAFNGTIQYQGISPGYHTKIEPSEYAGGIMVERRLIDTDRYDVIEGRAKGLARAANRKMNKIAHEPFIYHTSTAFSFMTSEEGVALCSNSHTTKSGTSTTSGFDNLSTLPFNAVNLEAVRIQSLGLKSDISERIDTNFDTIVHGSNNAEAVWEVINSQGKVDEMTNNANFQHKKWKQIELPLLDDYDTNDWFIVDSGAMKEYLIWIDSVPLEFMSTTDFDTMVRKYADYFVIGYGFTDWRWAIGCSVS
uniref:Putative capsid protein n=2 Tax=viral metagenome TaxID=1070528 RepID=A0A6M3K1U5_9ZZZZ